VWHHIQNWFATHDGVTAAFLPDKEDTGIYAQQGYLRLWLTEAVVRKDRTDRGDRVLAFHGGVTLTFGGAMDTSFTRFTRLAGGPAGPGAILNLPVTPLIPFQGGPVRLQAAMYRTPSRGALAGAAEVAGALTEIADAPLSWVAATSTRLDISLERLLADADGEAVLAAQWGGDEPGGGGRMLRSGHLVMVNVPAEQIPGLRIADGRLRADGAVNAEPLSAADYMVLRLECRREREDWRFPQLDALIRAAFEAALNGYQDRYLAIRAQAIVSAWNSADLTPIDRRRVAKVVADEIDNFANQADADVRLDTARLPEPYDPALSQVELPQLLGEPAPPIG